MWSFDVFALNDASGEHALKFVFYELLTRYDLINRFKVRQQTVHIHCSYQSHTVCNIQFLIPFMGIHTAYKTIKLVSEKTKLFFVLILFSRSHFMCSEICHHASLFCCLCIRSLFLHSYHFWILWRWATANTRTPTTTWCMLLMSHRPSITCSSRPAWW